VSDPVDGHVGETPRPHVSVVIPTTGTRCLHDTVSSALGQQGVEVEVVVVMNAAGDLPPVPDDPRVRVVRSDPALAGNGARSHGIRESSHDLVALLDDDDYWRPDKLARQHRYVLDQQLPSDAWVVSCAVVEHGADGASKVVPTEDPGEVADVAEYLAGRPRLRSIGQQFQSSTLLFPRRLGVEHPFDPAVRVHQDWGWVVECQQAGATILCLYEPLSHRSTGSADALTRSITWRSSLEWADRHLAGSSLRARGDFAMTIAADRAVAARSLAGWLACGWVAVRHGRPGWTAWVFYLFLITRLVRSAPLTGRPARPGSTAAPSGKDR
jgi:hypothetical protein